MLELSNYIPVAALAKYLLTLSVVGLGAMVWDKFSAKAGLERVSERGLHIIAGVGGFPGIIGGGLLVHHKTSKPGFWAPVGFTTFLWAMFLVAYFFPWAFPF